MKFPRLTRLLPTRKNAALAVVSAVLLIFAFPDFDLWFLAWFALAPLLWAISRQSESTLRSFILGWLWGMIFFTGTCWWLTFAPVTYAGFPSWLAYILLLCVTTIVGVFPGIFGAIVSILFRRFGTRALLAAPFVWVFTEFLRYWLTGNNWNALAYSQSFGRYFIEYASIGGIYFVGFLLFIATGITVSSFMWIATAAQSLYRDPSRVSKNEEVELIELSGDEPGRPNWLEVVILFSGLILFFLISALLPPSSTHSATAATVVAIQPNVPMSGLDESRWRQLRAKHVELAETGLASIQRDPQSAIRNPQSTTVVFPESPMNFMWEDDEEFRNFVHAFAAKHDVQLLFNSAEPDGPNNKYFNSAVLVGPDGRELAQYDKIYLLPFGESVPAPLQSIVPAFVGSFSYGKEYDLLPLGEAKAGVMICFESHFGELGREYVRNGADVIIEMTNDGYLGPTPVLRQHLANAVFRAVETNRPVIRATNVGVTAYISERGEIRDAAEGYTEASRVWSVAKSDGSQTFYVKYGDWFAWLCSLVTIGLLGWAFVGRRRDEKRMAVPPA